uniref:Pacifastin domain-containing protein n=1 Tax=Macrostomum lignano TaxID=282301 RepID=A0A1I8JGC1_9PLAT
LCPSLSQCRSDEAWAARCEWQSIKSACSQFWGNNQPPNPAENAPGNGSDTSGVAMSSIKIIQSFIVLTGVPCLTAALPVNQLPNGPYHNKEATGKCDKCPTWQQCIGTDKSLASSMSCRQQILVKVGGARRRKKNKLGRTLVRFFARPRIHLGSVIVRFTAMRAETTDTRIT